MKIKLKNLQYITLSCSTLLIILGIATLCPIIPNQSNATDTINTSNSTQIRAVAQPVISISVPSAIDVEITPNSNGAYNYINTKLQVSTNSIKGFELLINSVDTTNMVSNDTNNSHVISASTKTSALSSYANNTWGYYFGTSAPSSSSSYKPTKTTSQRIYSTNSASTTQTYNLAFGAKIDSSLPAGLYTNSVVLSAIANPLELRTLNDITYMQDMTTDICTNTAVDTTKQLVDIRDDQSYWVAKLADGHCWMTQNLALDLSTSKPLTPSDSDVNSNWTPSSSTATALTPNPISNSTALSWNLGDYVLTNPTASHPCSTSTNLSGCSFYQQIQSGMMPNFTATSTSSIASDGKSYDAHFLIGNYYQYNAATANSAVSGFNINDRNYSGLTNPSSLMSAPNSICPKGWKLPVSGGYHGTHAKWPFGIDGLTDSFYQVLQAYRYPATGILGTTGDSAVPGWSQSPSEESMTGAYTSITATPSRLDYSPLDFVRAGYINVNDGTIGELANSGVYWSSTMFPSDSKYSYGLYFNNTAVFPAAKIYMYQGLNVRCLAR